MPSLGSQAGNRNVQALSEYVVFTAQLLKDISVFRKEKPRVPQGRAMERTRRGRCSRSCRKQSSAGPGGSGAGALLEQVREEMGAEMENWKWRRLLLFQVLEM